MTESAPVVLEARGLVKRFGHVTALAGADFELRAGEILAVVGDNGAGKSSLIKVLTGAMVPDAGELYLDGERVHFHTPSDARRAGIETGYQELAVAPALDVSQNLFLGREQRRPGIAGTVFRRLDKKAMRRVAAEQMSDLGVRIQSIQQKVETLSGGQRQAVAVARAAAWGRRVVVLDEPTAALGIRETNQVLELVVRVRNRGLPVVLISHNMPQVFEVADRIHIMRLGRRVAVVRPRDATMSDVVAVMTGAIDELVPGSASDGPASRTEPSAAA
jgi:fructose transport system ATP-binding protein